MHLHILNKILFGVLLVAPLFLVPSIVEAAKADVSIDVTMNVNNNNEGRIVYNVDIQNTDSDFIDSFILDVPHTSVRRLSASIAGRTIPSPGYSRVGRATNIRLDFPDDGIIRTGKSKKLRLEFTADGLIHTQDDLRWVKLSPLEATYNLINLRYRINLPSSFDQLIYSSDPSVVTDGTNINVNLDKELLLVWGSTTLSRDVNYRITNTADAVSLYNLPRDDQINKTDLLGIRRVGRDTHGNDWVFVDPGKLAVVSAQVDLGRTEATSFNSNTCGTFRLPEQLSGLENTTLSVIRNYIYENYEVDFPGLGIQFDETALAAKLENEQGTINRLEMVCLLSDFYTQTGGKSRIVYGYYIPDFFSRIDSTLPYVWIEYQDEGQIKLFDPYLSYISGYDNSELPPQLVLPLGTFNSDNDFDRALGMRSGELIYRPQLGLTESEQRIYAGVDVDADFPAQVFSGEYFGGNLNIINKSDNLIQVDSILLDGRDISYVMKLYPGIEPLLMPGSNQYQVGFMREPNFLRNQVVSHDVVINFANLPIEFVDSSFDIKYEPDNRLIVAGIALVVILLLISVVVILRYFYRTLRVLLTPKPVSFGSASKSKPKPAANRKQSRSKNKHKSPSAAESDTAQVFSIKDL